MEYRGDTFISRYIGEDILIAYIKNPPLEINCKFSETILFFCADHTAYYLSFLLLYRTIFH